MRFDILTIFPKILDSYFNESILKRAQKKNLIKISIHDIRKYTTDKHKTVDDRPYGGGAGMVMKVGPIFKALCALKIEVKGQKSKGKSTSKKLKAMKTRTILLAANGKQFTQRDAKRLSKYDRLVFIAGRYEGIDARAEKFVDEKISIGQYVLAGGELPAAIITEAVARLIPGILGNEESIIDESFSISKETKKLKSEEANLEYPHYTRPEVFKVDGKKYRVPKVLLSGDHKKIKEWRDRECR